MSPAAALAAALAAAPSWGADAFLKNVRKAETRKEPEERVEYLTRAIKEWSTAHPRTILAACHLGRGEARVELWEFKDSEPDLSRALELDEGASRAYRLRGRARLKLGRAAEAARDFSAYAAFKPEDAESWLDLGEAELARGDAAAALAAYAKADQQEPGDWRAALGAGRARMLEKDWRSALERLDAAEAASKNKAPEVFLERAVARVALGRHAQAVEDYSSALPLLERRSESMRRGRAPARALEEEQALLGKTYYGRARVREFLLRMPEAAADYQQACDLSHQEACARLTAARAAAEPKAELEPPAAESEPAPEAPRRKRRRYRKVSDDAGDRIYGF